MYRESYHHRDVHITPSSKYRAALALTHLGGEVAPDGHTPAVTALTLRPAIHHPSLPGVFVSLAGKREGGALTSGVSEPIAAHGHK